MTHLNKLFALQKKYGRKEISFSEFEKQKKKLESSKKGQQHEKKIREFHSKESVKKKP